MLRVVHRRHVAPLALAVALLVPGLLAGLGGAAVPGGTGPTVTAVPHDGPLGAVPARDLEPEPGARYGAHPVTFPSEGSVRARPAVAKDPATLPDFSDRVLPAQVLAAYRRAASVLTSSNPGCRLDWELLAAIGKVESGHAYGGAVDRSGDTLVPILGPVLDGGPGVAAIPDTDDGRWDTDKTWDRAVGPMQFIPGSWVLYGQDGNGDGRRDPSNVMDSVLASAYYLCSGGGNLGVEKDRRAAVFSYNHSWDYVDLVLAWAEAYADGTPVLTGALLGYAGVDDSGRRGGNRGGGDRPATPSGPRSSLPAATPSLPGVPPPSTAPATGAPAPDSPNEPSGPKDEPRGESTAASPRGSEPAPTATREPSPSSSSSDPPTAEPSDPPSDPPSDDPSDTPSDPPSPDPCPTSSETPTPTESPTPSPTQVEATPSPTPTTTCGPSGA